MNILAIIGSPRKKGNSYNVTKYVESILQKNPDMNVEYLFLQDMNLKQCIGCHNCIFVGEEKCPLKDDRDLILSKMKSADGVIFVCPTYVINVTTLFKNFIDHFAFLCHRPVFYTKYAMLISTTGGMGEKKTLKLMKTPVSIWGFHVVSMIGLRTSPMDDLNDVIRKNHRKIKKKVDKFYRKVSAAKTPSPGLFSLVQFFMFTKIAYMFPETLKADYAFYKDKQQQGFYENIKINPLKKGIAKILVKLFTMMG